MNMWLPSPRAITSPRPTNRFQAMLHKISNSPHRLACPKARPTRQRRQGVVLLAVLIVVVLLSLAAYNYSDLMTAQYKASDNYHKNAQARGVCRFRHPLRDGHPHQSGQYRQPPEQQSLRQFDLVISESRRYAGQRHRDTSRLPKLAPERANNTGGTNTSGTGICQFGFIDESGKININAMMASDPTGNQLYQMLLLLPNMTDRHRQYAHYRLGGQRYHAACREGSERRTTTTMPCRLLTQRPRTARSTASEELLPGQGRDSTQLLFGSDLNRNGYQDPTEVDDGTVTSTGFDRGPGPRI